MDHRGFPSHMIVFVVIILLEAKNPKRSQVLVTFLRYFLQSTSLKKLMNLLLQIGN